MAEPLDESTDEAACRGVFQFLLILVLVLGCIDDPAHT